MTKLGKRRVLALVATVLLVAGLAGFLLLSTDPPPVKALRYKVLWGESAMELSHGAGQWVEEIYLPDRKVACTLVYEYPALAIPEGKILPVVRRRPRLYARAADRPRNDLTGFGNTRPSVIEEIEVPGELANYICDLVELEARTERESLRLGREVVAKKLMKELPLKALGD